MKKRDSVFKSSNMDILLSLLSEYQWLKLLFDRNKPYEKLLSYLFDLGKYESLSYDNYQREKRQIKYMAEKLNLSYANVRKWIPMIYEDVFELNYNEPNLFVGDKQYPYRLNFSCDYGELAVVNLGLPVQLNIGDAFNFYFVKAKTQSHFFSVKKISFTHEYGDCLIEVTLKSGWYNSYRELLFDKAKFTRRIGSLVEYDLKDYELDEKLLELHNKGL